MIPLVAKFDPVWMFVAGCALLTYVLLRRSYRYFGSARNRKQGPYLERLPRPKSAWDGMPRDAAAQIERQKVELYDMSRELNAELSSRIVILEQLIADSGQQIERMESLLAELHSAEEEPARH